MHYPFFSLLASYSRESFNEPVKCGRFFGGKPPIYQYTKERRPACLKETMPAISQHSSPSLPSALDGPSKSSLRTRLPAGVAGYLAEKVGLISGLELARF